MENAARIVTIKERLPLYKGDEMALRIELVTFEENGFHVVSQKNLYLTGDKAVFIIPDYCVSPNTLFNEFIAPGGDESKSYLGKVNGEPRRIRAKKFSMSLDKNGEHVYSNGILLPLKEVASFLGTISEVILKRVSDEPDWLTEKLGITKYEEPDTSSSGLVTRGGRSFPSGVYKTDETNINLLWNHIEQNIGYPVILRGTEKIDGSSISIGITDEFPEGFIASRNLIKPLEVREVTGRRLKTWWEKLLFWRHPDLNTYTMLPNTDSFVVYGKKYLDLMRHVELKNIILRGELNGGSVKGSGNKNNPSSKKTTNIVFFNADKFENGVAVKMPTDEFKELCRKWFFPMVPECFVESFTSREHIEKSCEAYFKLRKNGESKELIEGIVLNTLDNKFSAKFMNDEYDSKK